MAVLFSRWKQHTVTSSQSPWVRVLAPLSSGSPQAAVTVLAGATISPAAERPHPDSLLIGRIQFLWLKD